MDFLFVYNQSIPILCTWKGVGIRCAASRGQRPSEKTLQLKRFGITRRLKHFPSLGSNYQSLNQQKDIAWILQATCAHAAPSCLKSALESCSQPIYEEEFPGADDTRVRIRLSSDLEPADLPRMPNSFSPEKRVDVRKFGAPRRESHIR